MRFSKKVLKDEIGDKSKETAPDSKLQQVKVMEKHHSFTNIILEFSSSEQFKKTKTK